MTALVVYESMFGNTKEVALAIRRGLAAGGLDARLMEVGDGFDELQEQADLFVVGGPTHAFGLSRESTRSDAARQSSTPVISLRRGLREWIDGAAGLRRSTFAAFDTKVRRPRLPGSAAKAASKRLRAMGWAEVTSPVSFSVDGTMGPLLDGELERAERWGASIAAAHLRSFVP